MRPTHPAQLSLDYEGVNQYWRPLIVTAQLFQRETRPTIAAVRCKKQRSGRLQGTQLDLFSLPPADPNFYRPVVRNLEKPLIDLFPEAYE